MIKQGGNMDNTTGLKQPLLGAVMAIIAIALALFVCRSFAPPVLGSWVAELIMSAIPAQIVIGLVWQSRYPGFIANLTQPAKGIAILGVMAVAAAIMTPVILALVGGGLTPPLPFAIMFTILSVCTCFWAVAVFQCWPFTALGSHPALIGGGVFVLAYVAAWVLFHFGFDFAAMKGAPFYAEALDPKGALPAWSVLAFTVTTVSVIMWFVMLDFWPTATIAAAIPALGRQPLFGLVSGALVLALSWGLWTVFVGLLGMDVVDYMVRVPVSGLFGEFIMLVMMQTAPFQTVKQPVKGLILLVVVAVLALIMYAAYRAAALALVGPMAAGAPGYDLDLWIATAMLSVTFPIFVALGDGFAFWPLSRAKAQAAEAPAE
jgi:hypothetical protein